MVDIEKLISVSNELVEFLKDPKDLNCLRQFFGNFEALTSSCATDFNAVQGSIEDYQRKIHELKQKTDEAKSEVILDEELDHFQDVLEEGIRKERSLEEELRKVIDEMNDLEHLAISMEERKRIINESEKDRSREERLLSMYASVTNIIPRLDDQFEISGHIVDRATRAIDEFKFDAAKMSSFQSCNAIWKMIDP